MLENVIFNTYLCKLERFWEWINDLVAQIWERLYGITINIIMDPKDNFLNIYSVRGNILLASLASDNILQNGGN